MKKERNWKIGSLLADKIIFLSTILICSLQYAICVEEKQYQCYQRLAMALDIDITFCHFGYFDQEQLEKAYQVMLAWKK